MSIALQNFYNVILNYAIYYSFLTSFFFKEMQCIILANTLSHTLLTYTGIDIDIDKI